MARTLAEIAGREITGPEQFSREVLEPCRPLVLRGLIEQWPAVQAALRSPRDLQQYFATFDAGLEVEAFVGEQAIAGKYYYGADLKGFNFDRRQVKFLDAVGRIIDTVDRPDCPTLYVGSVPVAQCLPGFTAANALALLPARAGARIWIGHRSNVSSHYDTFDNVACVLAGHRRFTLYAPELVGRLYMGPIDHTMAGPPVSLAASADAPDPQRYPLFEQIRGEALVAELEPGDALYLPKLWWHQVESLAPFNAMINHWWDAFSAGPDAPYTSLLFAMIAIAERPPAERQAWKAFFDHFVFRTEGHPLRHLPEAQHGLLGPLKPDNYNIIRARIMRLMRGG